MEIEELQKRLEEGVVAFHGTCHDCGVPVDVLCATGEGGGIKISGGAVYNPKTGTPPTERTFFKCDACFREDRVLRGYQPCEVYIRIVGYLRLVQQWNVGKVEEFKQRKEFVVGKKKR